MFNNHQDANDDVELASLLEKKQTYEAEREAPELCIQELNQNIIQVQAEYAAINNERVPVLKLPTEVTCSIFDFATMEDIDDGRDLEPQVVVSHVCHQWRSISLSYSRLWTTFCYDLPKALCNPLDRLDAYLERSASQALEFWFDFREAPSENHLALLEKTLAHIERWKRVTVLSDGENPLFSFIPSIKAVAAPNLEHFAFRSHLCLTVSRGGSVLSINNLEPTIFTNGAPKLRSLLLDCSSLICLPSLSNITTLRLEAIGLDAVHPFSWLTFLDILTLPSLANLSLMGKVFERPGPGMTVPLITMSNLIDLRCMGPHGLSALLPYLRAPILQTLSIQFDRFPDEFGTYGEPQAFPSLGTLSLSTVEAVQPQVAWYFVRLTERATQILISHKEFRESFFAVLQNHQEFSPTAYWTKVKLLTCNFTPTEEIMRKLILFAKARAQNTFILRIFDHMDKFWRLAQPAEYETLKELCIIETMDANDDPLSQDDWPPDDSGEDSNCLSLTLSIDAQPPLDITDPYKPYLGMSNIRQDPSEDAELARLLQRKRTYQAERKVLELRIEKLDHNIIEVQAEYGAIYNKRASVLKLPTEVTCMIFDSAAGYPMQGDSEEGRHLLIEVVVSHVCRQWRSTSLAFPRLWASFCYDGPKSNHVPLGRLEAYLERSASQPLELWLHFREDSEKSPHLVDNSALLQKTISHVARWKRVTISSDWHTPLDDLLPELQAVSAPNLEYFAFCCDIANEMTDETISHLYPAIFTNGAPNLTSVMLDCSSSKCLPPLSNITTLRLEALANGTLSPFSWSTFLEILSLPYLANLSLLGNVFEGPDDHTTIDLIIMNSLKHFRYSAIEGMTRLLPYFRAPLLETLIMKNDWLPEEFGTSAEPYVFPSLRSLCLIETIAATPQVALHFAQMTGSATEILSSQADSNQNFFMTLQGGPALSSADGNYWTKVKLFACNSTVQSDIAYFILFAKSRPKNDLVLRIFDPLDKHWRQEYPHQYSALTEVCTIEIMDVEDNPLEEYSRWPPGEYNPAYLHEDEDPFDIHPY